MATPVFYLSQGCKGPATKRVQAAVGATADGVYGPKTADKVAQYQKKVGLTADGVAGVQTLTSLNLPIPVLAVDVSRWQGGIDWPRMAKEGVKVAIVRTSHGLGEDTNGKTNLVGAVAAGLRVWAYHYAKPDGGADDAIKEAQFAVATATPAIPIVLDLEERNGLTSGEVAKWAATWLRTVWGIRGGQWPLVYANADFILREYSKAEPQDQGTFTQCALWLANPDGDGDGNLPKNPIWNDCAAVQFSWTGDLGGESPLDLDWWYL